MRMILVLVTFGLMVAGSAQAGADTVTQKKSITKKSKAVKAQAKSKAKKGSAAGQVKKGASNEGHLSTDVSFDDSVLRGEYQAPEEALAKVENEKGFGDLIGVRKHFKDRLSVAAEQE